MNHIWFGKSLEESIAAPIVFVDSGNALKFEPNFDKVPPWHTESIIEVSITVTDKLHVIPPV